MRAVQVARTTAYRQNQWPWMVLDGSLCHSPCHPLCCPRRIFFLRVARSLSFSFQRREGISWYVCHPFNGWQPSGALQLRLMTLRAHARPLTFNCHLLFAFLLYSSGLSRLLSCRRTYVGTLPRPVHSPSFFSLFFCIFSSIASRIQCFVRHTKAKSSIKASRELVGGNARVN